MEPTAEPSATRFQRAARRPDGPGADPDTGVPRPPRPDEVGRLLDFLDDGLRGGRRGRLAAEYPTALGSERCEDQLVIERDGRFEAHVLVRRLDAVSFGRRVPLGLIGLVYTIPERRGRGLARRCIEAACRRLARDGAWVVLLWSDLDDFYRRLGFLRVGREWHYRFDRRVCERARSRLASAFRVGPPSEKDWPRLEALYALKPLRAEREPGELKRLASAPDCDFVVARRGGDPAAYAALGRGDDFAGVVHEWAGEPAAVVACLAHFAEREERELGWLVGPDEAPPAAALRTSGALRFAGDFAWARLLDPRSLWRSRVADTELAARYRLEPRAAGWRLLGPQLSLDLDLEETTHLLLGPVPARVARHPSWCELRTVLPVPLFLWGFDSI